MKELPPRLRLEKEQIARQFSRAAQTYDRVSQLQRAMSRRLIGAIEFSGTGLLVDFGCGTGESLLDLAREPKRNALSLLGLDIAPGMIELASQKAKELGLESRIEFRVADIDRSELPDESVAIAFSNAAIQWSELGSIIAEFRRILKAGGQLLVSTFGPQTMLELRQAWQEIGDANPRVHAFASLNEIRAALDQNGFRTISSFAQTVELEYPSLGELFRGIKQLGATNAHSARSSALLGRETYRRLCRWFEERPSERRYRLTFEPIYVVAEK